MTLQRSHKSSRGIALVLVMWVLALLTVMALALTQIQRTESALTANQLESARFRAQAEAVVSLVALDLLSTPSTTFDDAAMVWIPDGRTRAFQLDGEELLVTLSNDGSKLDLNSITAEQLVSLMQVTQDELSLDIPRLEQIADAIVDWRDENNLSMPNGAEDADYEAEGMPYGAADRPFQSVEELQQVLGMSRSIYAAIAPFLRVETGQGNPYAAFSAGQGQGQGSARATGQIDETFAAAPVLAVLNGYSLDNAQQIVEQRFQGLFADDAGEQRAPPQRGGPIYQLQIRRPRTDAPGPTMDVLIQIEPGSPAAFEVLWQRFGTQSRSPQEGIPEWP